MRNRLDETNHIRKLMGLSTINESVIDGKSGAKSEHIYTLKDAIGGIGTDEEKVYELLGKLTKGELDSLDKYFKRTEGVGVREYILSDFSGEEYKQVEKLLNNIK
jgi:hypothetical protein